MAQHTFGWYPVKGCAYTVTSQYNRSQVRVEEISHKHRTLNLTVLNTALREIQTEITFDEAADLVWETNPFV